MPDLSVLDTPAALTKALAAIRLRGHRIGLIPTMGNLHAGHLALVAAARTHCDYLLATIFVNPLQFGPNEDLGRYPRTFQDDCAALAAAGCDAVFAPAAADLYPAGLATHTRISVPGVSALHCGNSRPGHFDGVCTVVCKLFNMSRPDHAFFGLKDFQQFHIIRRMVEDLQIPVQLHGIPTVREAGGLALSSRNGYLDPNQRRQAEGLYAMLQELAALISGGRRDHQALEAHGATLLAAAGLRSDYIHVCARDTLEPATDSTRELVILAAAFAGTTRLIDNIQVSLPDKTDSGSDQA